MRVESIVVRIQGGGVRVSGLPGVANHSTFSRAPCEGLMLGVRVGTSGKFRIMSAGLRVPGSQVLSEGSRDQGSGFRMRY